MKKLLNNSLQIFLALLIILGASFFVLVATSALLEILMKIDSITIYHVAIFGPFSIYSWLILLILFSVPLLTLTFFIFWVARDSRKFRDKGIKTSPFLWAIGVALPTIIVIFPLYLIRRNIIWPRELKENNIKVQP